MGAVYPSTLPTLDFASIRYRRVASVIETATEAGIPKRRRRFTAHPRYFEQTMILNEAQLLILETFFFETLGGGVLPFDHEDPLNGGTVECEFQMPEFNFEMIVHSSSPTKALWQGSVSYRVLE